MSSSTLRVLGYLALALSRFRRRGRRRGGPCRKRSRLIRAFIACANRPVRRQELLLWRRVERPRLVSVRQPVERWFWLGRPLQLQHLWRLRDPATSSPQRRRFPSPGSEPRLSRASSRLGGSAPASLRRPFARLLAAPQAFVALAPAAFMRSPSFHAGAATVTPGFAGGGFHGGLGGGNFHQFHGAGVPHIGAPVSPGFAGGGGLHGLGGATGVHIGAPASPGVCARRRFPWRRRFPRAWRGHRSPHRRACLPRFRGRRRLSMPAAGWELHIGAPASPSFAGVGTFHAGGGVGAPTSARRPRQVLPAAGFMALEGAGFPGRRGGVRTGRHRTSLSAWPFVVSRS